MRHEEKVKQLIREMFNKMLERHGVDYDFIIKNYQDPDKRFYEDYTWTMAEEREFVEWAEKLTRKKLGSTAKTAAKEVGWFMLMYGLKCSDYEK